MQMLEEKQRETQEMEKYLQKKRLELEADEQQSLLVNSIHPGGDQKREIKAAAS